MYMNSTLHSQNCFFCLFKITLKGFTRISFTPAIVSHTVAHFWTCLLVYICKNFWSAYMYTGVNLLGHRICTSSILLYNTILFSQNSCMSFPFSLLHAGYHVLLWNFIFVNSFIFITESEYLFTFINLWFLLLWTDCLCVYSIFLSC